MGDVAIAKALRAGVGDVIAVLGSTYTLIKKGARTTNPLNPSQFTTRDESHDFEGVVSDVEDRAIDGVLVKRGDKQITLRGGNDAPTPKVNDEVRGGGQIFKIVRVDTTIIANEVVAYKLLLR